MYSSATLSLPPQIFRQHDDADYFPSAVRDIGRIIDEVGISPAHKVLDVGCAAGRLANPLVELLDPAQGGAYLGIDVKPGAIQWAKENITQRHPHIRFQHLDARSGVVNPTGTIEQSEVRFPASDGEIDLITLSSVFTHMITDGIRRYVSEAGRCLRPGGALYFTAFLFDLEAWKACKERKPAWNFAHRHGDVMVHDPKRPEYVAAIFEEFIYQTTSENGLTLHSLYKGAWREGGPGGQDLLFFKKLPAS